MIFLLFVLSIVIQLIAIWAIFFFNLNRVIGSVITIAVAILTALILTPWSLLLGIPLIALSIIILFKPLRFSLITKPAYKTLSNSMPSISTTEQEA